MIAHISNYFALLKERSNESYFKQFKVFTFINISFYGAVAQLVEQLNFIIIKLVK